MSIVARSVTGLLFVLTISLFFLFGSLHLFVWFLWCTALWILVVEWVPLVVFLPIVLSLLSFLFIIAGFGILSVFNACRSTRILVALIFLSSMVHDTTAYVAGNLFGRHLLCPSVSPGKTWEGFVGGMLGVLGFLYVLMWPSLESVSTGALWFIFALGLAVCATLGDLFESLLKRKAGIKDSGCLLPGHGGLFDRFDSILGVALWAYPWKDFLLHNLQSFASIIDALKVWVEQSFVG